MASNYPPAYGSFVPQGGNYPPPQQSYNYAPQGGGNYDPQAYSYPPPPQNSAYSQGFQTPTPQNYAPQDWQGQSDFYNEPISSPQQAPKGSDYESGPSEYRDLHGAESSRFVENTGWRDMPFLIIFLLHFLLVGVVFVAGCITRSTGAGAHDDIDSKPLPEPTGNNDAFQYFMLVALLSAGLSLVLAYLWLLAVQKFAKHLIKVALFFSVGLMVALAVISFVFGAIISGVFFIIFAGLLAFFYYSWRRRIAFATRMLVLCGSLVERFPATARVAYLAILIQFVWITVWSITVALSQQYAPALSIALAIFLIFSLYWTSQVIKNVVHVTGAGTFATWYFMEGTVGIPPNPTLKSLKRACTTSIGSICLGSMIVAIVKTMRAIANCLRMESDNIILCLLAFVATCILDIIDSLMQYFNQYAFAQIAIYGKTYCQAAKDTWDLVHSHGVEAIINDNLIGNVTTMACFISGAVVGTFGAVLAYLLRDQLGGNYWLEMLLLMFFVGFLVVMVTMEVVESAVVTIFCCFAEDPQALQRNSPKLYKKLKKTYEERCTLFN